MPSIAVSFVAAKRNFSRRDVLLHLVGINFRVCGILIDLDNSRRFFWRRLCAVWAISGSRHQPRSRCRSISCDRVNINKPKLRNFDRPLGFRGQLQWSFWCRQRISSKYDGAGAWQLPLPSATEQQSRSRRRKRCKSGRYTRYLRNFDGPLG